MRGLAGWSGLVIVAAAAVAAEGQAPAPPQDTPAAQAPAAPQGRGGGRQMGVAIAPGEECPPGTTEVRHLRCQAPDRPAPSIVDYRPKSTVVAEAHLVPRAKFPAVDIHSHLSITPANIERARSKARNPLIAQNLREFPVPPNIDDGEGGGHAPMMRPDPPGPHRPSVALAPRRRSIRGSRIRRRRGRLSLRRRPQRSRNTAPACGRRQCVELIAWW